MLIKYFANDGKDFGSEKECLDYEEKLKQYELYVEHEKRKAEKKQARWEEVEKAKEKYDNLSLAYEKDYGHLYCYTPEDVTSIFIGGKR